MPKPLHALVGKAGAGEGDTLEDPTNCLAYDLHAWKNHGRPVFVETQARERHGVFNPRWQRSITYSDGHGQEVMKKVQAEPGYAPRRDAEGNLVRDSQGKVVEEHTADRWVGTGRTVFNNKGNPIKHYEPFFSSTPAYEDEQDVVETGVTPILHYDPVGRLVRTENPDGTEVRTVFDAWTEETWDENDSLVDPETGDSVRWAKDRAGLPEEDPERRALELALAHARTPNSTELDVLGRPVVTIENNGEAGPYETHVTLDIVGNQRSVVDAKGNIPARQDFDLLKRPLRVDSCDAGDRRTLPDVTGKPIYTWDARGTIVRRCFDALERPTHVYITTPGNAEVLAERTFYGEKHPDRLARNLAGKPCLAFDGAGAAIQDAYDFKGNPVRTLRRLSTQFQGAVDWSALASATILPGDALGLAATQLETEVFESSSTFDALGRLQTSTSPDGSVTRPTFNEANLLERLEVRLRGAAGWTPFVVGVDYNARGQRLVIEYGNGTRAKYTYNPERFRLTRLRTTRGSDGHVLQDLRYTYDPVGNIVEFRDESQQESFFSGSVVSARGLYEYDALYRLTHAEGREHPGQQPSHEDPVWAAVPHANDLAALVRYAEAYSYDEVGNITTVGHTGSNNWSRGYRYEATSNRLTGTTDGTGQWTQAYAHDADGNMTSMPHLASMTWDHAQRTLRIDKPGNTGTVHFAYDAAGNRVRKVFVHATGRDERIYLGGYEVFRKHASGAVTFERQTLHVFDDKTRVALVETKTRENGVAVAAPTPLSRYQLAAYHPSVAVELDAAGQLISYEEYYPFGATAFHSQVPNADLSQKRYRHLGNERDEETGLTHHGARLYAAWIGRWTSADPAGQVDGPNLYSYVNNRPIILRDPTGMEGWGPDTHPESVQRIMKETPPPPQPPPPPESKTDDPTLVDEAQSMIEHDLRADWHRVRGENAEAAAESARAADSAGALGREAALELAPVGGAFGIVGKLIGKTRLGKWLRRLAGNLLPKGNRLTPESAPGKISPTLPNDAARGGARGGAKAVRKGQEGEAAVRGLADIGPKTKIEINGRKRIPDGLTDDVLTEVKNVDSLSYTRQLRDYAEYARENGLRFELWVKPDTKLSEPLLDAIEKGEIIRRLIP